MSEIPFKDLPLYSYDYDANYPPEGKAFKDPEAYIQFTPGLINEDGEVTAFICGALQKLRTLRRFCWGDGGADCARRRSDRRRRLVRERVGAVGTHRVWTGCTRG